MPAQRMPGTVNLVTQWKSAVTSLTGIASTSSQRSLASAPDSVAPKIRRSQVSRWNAGTGP